jgi:hypothetical protein
MDMIYIILQSYAEHVHKRKQGKTKHLHLPLSFTPDSHNSIKLKTHKCETKSMLSIVEHQKQRFVQIPLPNGYVTIFCSK